MLSGTKSGCDKGKRASVDRLLSPRIAFFLLAVRASFGTAAHTGGKNAGREPWTHVDTRLQNCARAGQRIFTAKSFAAARLRGGPIGLLSVGTAFALAGVFSVQSTRRLVVLPGVVASTFGSSLVPVVAKIVISVVIGCLVPNVPAVITTGSWRGLPVISPYS